MHAIKFQGIMISDGMISLLAGLVERSVGDWKLFKDSGIEYVLRKLFSSFETADWLYLYGDPAYYG
jgi:hypothetical protein